MHQPDLSLHPSYLHAFITSTMLNQLAADLLLAVRYGRACDACLATLRDLPPGAVGKLRGDASKMAFWINLYNACYQMLRQSFTSKEGIYRLPAVVVAGQSLSLDDVEHGILRKLQYGHRLSGDDLIERTGLLGSWQVEHLDYRIHFALNCGAVSCPPISHYEVEQIDRQLEVAMLSFLEDETAIDDLQKTVTTSQLLDWYAEDFGGAEGILQLLSDTLHVDLKGYELHVSPYDWSDHLQNFDDGLS